MKMGRGGVGVMEGDRCTRHRGRERGYEREQFVCWLLNVPATG